MNDNFDTMTADELHALLEQKDEFYQLVKHSDDWVTTEALCDELIAIANELRKRHQLWTTLPDAVLLKRYSIGLRIDPLDHVMDEWQEEIERRGLSLPAAWPDEYEAYAYWHDPEAKD